MDLETWENLPPKTRPYPDRLNVVIGHADSPGDSEGTPQPPPAPLSPGTPFADLPEGVLYYDSLEDALYELGDRDDLDELFVIGGEKLFAEAILHPDLEEIHLTRIEEDYECDRFFPSEIPEEYQVVSTSEIMESDALEYSFVILARQDEEDEDVDEDADDIGDYN